MKVSHILRDRQGNWDELEELCKQVESRSARKADVVTRFAALYRAACADLALAGDGESSANWRSGSSGLIAGSLRARRRWRKKTGRGGPCPFDARA